MIPHHVVDGSGPPLLMINSLGADLSMWEPQVADLSRFFSVIRYDARGHGQTGLPASAPSRFTLSDLGRDALDLLDHLGIARAAVCGLSLGGMTGMWLAAHAPARVDRLVLCCTSALLGPPSTWSQRAALVRSSGVAAIADGLLERWLTAPYRAAHPEQVTRLHDMITSTSVPGYTGCCAAIETMDLRPVLPTIAAPTLVIAGADDPATPPDHGAVIAAAIPDSRLAILPGAHLATWETPGDATALILEALDGS